VFNSPAGEAINASIIDMGNRFRLLVNEVKAIEVQEPLPKLPVARVLWQPKPDLKTGAAAWILAGGAHHTGYSQAVNTEFMEDFADMFDIELTVIDEHTRLREFKNELKYGDLYYQIRKEY
jgi:L-arabinose isomerase